MKHFFSLMMTLVFLSNQVIAQGGGTNDANFNVYDTPSSINGGVSGGLILDMLSLPNGKLIIAGTFKKYNDIPLPGIARLNADGSLDQTFNTGSSIGGDSIIKKVKLMADGRLLILGKFTCTQGSSVLINLARLNINGNPDLSFNPVLTGSDPITDVAIQANGDILVVEKFYIYKLNSSGTLIQSIFPEPNGIYGVNPRDGLNQVLENADGSVYVVGNYTNRSLNFRKILPDGTLTNIPGIDVFKIWHAALQPDGKLLLFGSIYLPGDPVDERRDAVRLNTNGTVDNSFHFSFTGNKPANYLSTSLSDVAFMTGNRMLLSYAQPKIFFNDGCVSNCGDGGFIFTPQCANPPCPCSERLDKLIYQINQNGSTVTSDTLNRIDFGGSSFAGSIDRMFMQNNQQLLVAGRFSYGTCPNSTAIPKNGFCRINLTYDEPCLAREVVPAAAGLLNCSNAVSGNLTNATVNGYASCSVNKDLWYSFTATNITHQIRVTGNGDFKPSVTLYNTGVCSSLGTGYLQCVSSDDPGGTAMITRRNLEIGGRYYLKISYAGITEPASQTFDICILTPVNDEPCNAIEVTPTAPGVSVCTNPVNGDVQVASFNNLVTCTPNNPDVWYKFTATSTSHVIIIAGNNLFEPAFAVFAASNCVDVALPAIFCAEGPASANGTTYGGLTGLTVGATYYIKVSNASSNSSASTTFSICVLTPVNDEACTAAILTPGLVGENTCSNPVTGNMLLATSSGIVFGCNGTGASGIPDLWYKFVATNSGHLIRIEGLSGIRLISLYSSNDCNNPGVRIQCNTAASNTVSLIAYSSLVPGNTYYVRINQSVSGTVPNFSICLLMPAANNEPCGAFNLISAAPGSTTCSNETNVFLSTAANEGTTCVGYNVLWYKFTASQTSHFLKMTGVDNIALYSAASCSEPMTQLLCKGTSCLDNMKQFSMKNLVVGTTYYLAVGGGDYSICLLSVDNDEPCAAKQLSNCSPITSDLSLATNTLNTYCNLQPPFVTNDCGFPFTIDAIQPNDLWYSFTATSDFASLIFNRVGTGFLGEMNFNLQLSSITDCQNPVVSCPSSSNRLITGSPLIRTFATVIGQTYYLSISNAEYNIPSGGGGLSIELRMGNSAVSITQDPSGSVCEGSTTTFTANPTNGGSNPQFTWQVNNVNVSTGPTFTSASLQDNDVVTCLLTSSNCVAPPTVSSSVTMDVFPIPTWYVDADGDGFGDGALPNIVNCIQPNGYVNNNTDCNDADAAVFPGSVSPRIFRSKQSGNWQSGLTWEAFDGCNWIPGLIPSSTDSTIIIMHDVTVNSIVNADQVVVNAGSSLNVSSGNFILNDGSGTDLVVNGIFNLSSNMSGNGSASIATGGQFNWVNGNFQSSSGSLLIEAGASATFNGGNGINQGRSLINNGVITWLGGQIVSGDGGSFINNHIIDIVSDINVNTNCTGCPGLNFTNASTGVITKSGGSGSSVMGNASNMIFNNNGVVNFNTGTIIFRGQGTHAGLFNIPAGQSLRFEQNNDISQNFNNGSSLQGSGSVLFINGIINFNSGSSYASTLPTMIAGAHVFWNMTALTINDLSFTAGRIHGTAAMTFPGSVIWSGGDWRGDGTATFTNTANVSFNGGGRAIYAGRNIINNGVITWSSGDLVSGDGGTFTNNHIINIYDNINVNTNCTGCPGLNFTNASTGVITKLGGTGTSVIGNASNMIFNNDGILNINSGSITFRGQGNHTGTFNMPASRSLRLEQNGGVVQNFNSGSSMQGAGSVAFINGNTNFNSGCSYAPTLGTNQLGGTLNWNAPDISINNYGFFGGIESGTGVLNILQSLYWSGGEWRGSGQTVLSNAVIGVFTGTDKQLSEGRVITNNGTITWDAGNLQSCAGGFFVNNGLLSITNNNSFLSFCSGNPGITVSNSGTIERTTAGTSTFNTYSSFSNIGTIKGLGTFRFENTSLQQNGTIAPGNPIGLLSVNGRQPFSSGSTLEVQFANGTSAGTDHDQFSVAGNLTLNGTLNVTALGFVPIGTYTIITVTNGTISGNFSAVNLPVGFSLVINSTTVELVRVSPCFNPAPVITASGPLTFCPGGSVVLTSSAASGNIWSNGATTQSVTVNASETFTVSNTDINGCISLPSTAVTVMIGFEILFYSDADGDGFGDPLVTITGICGTLPPVGYVSNNTDCNDTNGNIYPNVSPGVISGTNPLLVSQTSLFTASGMSGGAWSISDPQFATIDPISGMVSAIATGNTTISYTIPTCTGTETVTFDLSINPNISAGVVSGPTSLCIGATAVFTSTGTPGGTWSSSNTAIATVDPVSGLVTAISGGSANIIYTVGGTVSASSSLTIISNPVAVIYPGAGTAFCIGEARIFDSYFSSGGNWSSSNTAVATVSSNGMVTAVGGGVANIVYTSTNTCGVTATASAPIRVIPSSGTTVITGPVNVCGFVGSGIPVKYVASLPGISIFNWTVPPNVTIVSGQFTDTLIVTFAAGFTAQANKQINCSPSIDRLCSIVSLTPATLSLFSQLPGTPAPITSSLASVCRGDVITLRIPKVPGASSYRWGFVFPFTANEAIIANPNGFGENDTLVQVTFTNSFSSSSANFSVRAVNQCGSSNTRSISIVRETAATVPLINGPANVCEHLAPNGTPAVFSVAQQPGIISYNWILPPGVIDLTGQGTNTVSFKYPAGYSGGSISVLAINRCGTSSQRTKAISVLRPSVPGGIDVIQVVSCPNRIYTYSLAGMPANATAVNWTVPSGASILSGQGTISIAVSYPSTIVTGNITAQSSNNCGLSSIRSINVKLPACAPVTTKGSVEQQLMVKENATFDVQIYPNPTADYFRIKVRSGEKEKIIVQVYDLTGRRLSEHTLLHEQTIETGMHLKPGAYIIKIIQGKHCVVRKVIKQ